MIVFSQKKQLLVTQKYRIEIGSPDYFQTFKIGSHCIDLTVLPISVISTSERGGSIIRNFSANINSQNPCKFGLEFRNGSGLTDSNGLTLP